VEFTAGGSGPHLIRHQKATSREARGVGPASASPAKAIKRSDAVEGSEALIVKVAFVMTNEPA